MGFVKQLISPSKPNLPPPPPALVEPPSAESADVQKTEIAERRRLLSARGRNANIFSDQSGGGLLGG